MTYVYLTMTVPAALQVQCNALSEAAAGAAGRNVWTTPLSPTGDEPATHYIASGAVGDDMAYLLTHPDALAEATGMTLEQAQGLLGACDIMPLGANSAPEDEPPNAETLPQTLARLGLQFVRADMQGM